MPFEQKTMQPFSFGHRVRAVSFAAAILCLFPSRGRAAEAPPEEPPPQWKTTAALGITLTRGNSETVLGTANVTSEKKWALNEIGLGASATYGKNHGLKNAENFAGFGQYNRLVSERTFFYGNAEALHDSIADVEYRVSLSPGAGYYFLKSDRHKLRAQIGPGYVFESIGGTSLSYATLRAAERYELKINERARFWQSLDFSPRVEDFADYVMNLELGVATDITKSLGLRLFAQDTYRSRPARGRDNNDLKLVAGVEYKF